MAREWSWQEAVSGKKKATGGGGFVSTRLDFEIGDVQRVTIPYLIDSEGNPKLTMFTVPVHQIKERGFIKLTGPKGNAFSPFTIRCMNPLSQTDSAVRSKIVDRKQYCALCLLSSLEQTAKFKKIEDAFHSIEEYKAIPKEDEAKKEFNKKLNSVGKVEPSYRKRDGESKTQYETNLLILQFESTHKEISTDFGNQKVSTVTLDSKGLPKYKPVLMKASQTKLSKFQKAFQKAGQEGKLTQENLFSFEDSNGEKVGIAFIDFELTYPEKSDKKSSAADMEVRAVSSTETCITKEFVDSVLEKSEELLDKTNKAWDNSFLNLHEFTNEEYLEAMSDGGAYYNSLKDNYMTEKDVEFIEKVIETAGGNNQFSKKETGDEASKVERTEKTVAPTEKETVETTENPIDYLSL